MAYPHMYILLIILVVGIFASMNTFQTGLHHSAVLSDCCALWHLFV